MEAKNDAVYAVVSALPSGLKVFTSFPDVLMIPELIFGGLVWILIASSRVPFALVQGWIMFVSVTFFLGTFITLILYLAHIHKGKPVWTTFDAFFHGVAALFYLSASVLQALITISINFIYRDYQLNVAAVVFAYLATLAYVIHTIFSLLRWKKNP